MGSGCRNGEQWQPPSPDLPSTLLNLLAYTRFAQNRQDLESSYSTILFFLSYILNLIFNYSNAALKAEMIHYSLDFSLTSFTIKSSSEMLASTFDMFALAELCGLREGLFAIKNFLALLPHFCSACSQPWPVQNLPLLLSFSHPTSLTVTVTDSPHQSSHGQLGPISLPQSHSRALASPLDLMPPRSSRGRWNKAWPDPAPASARTDQTTSHQRNFSAKTREASPQVCAICTSEFASQNSAPLVLCQTPPVLSPPLLSSPPACFNMCFINSSNHPVFKIIEPLNALGCKRPQRASSSTLPAPFTRPAYSKLHPTWSWTFPVTGQLQLLSNGHISSPSSY